MADIPGVFPPWTAAELQNIEDAGKTYGGLIVSEIDGFTVQANRVLERFRPELVAGSQSRSSSGSTEWTTDQGTISMAETTSNYFGAEVSVPSNQVLASISGGPQDGLPSAIKLWPNA